MAAKGTPCFLAAPTGRAAKVISGKTGRNAKTIHSLIYTTESGSNGVNIRLTRKLNLSQKLSVFIIDEASMISDRLGGDEKFIATKSLLADLIEFVKEGNPGNKIIFIGDRFQLPPVNRNFSAALDPQHISDHYKLKVIMMELKEVMRQNSDSYILSNAIQLRNSMEQQSVFPGLQLPKLYNISDALSTFSKLHKKDQHNDVAFIAFTNKDVNWFNSAYRSRKFKQPQILMKDDAVVLNQSWSGEGKLLLKGEPAFITSVNQYSMEKVAGLTFMDVELAVQDENGESSFIHSKALLEVLTSEKGELVYETEQALYHDRIAKNKKFRETLRNSDDPYLGALRLRYGYALTCHKAQGGEWDNIILHPWFKKDDYRWQYTAITKGRKKVYSY
ncbi:MAG: AAA family ATPase [Bacteroidetes bacterium]|nr:AAA family ATPase [Bacteroidota bacterium]